MTDNWTATEWTRFAGRCRSHDVEPPLVYGCDDAYREEDGWSGSTYCGGVFRCARCDRLVCECSGGADEDERGDYCAECYCEVTCHGDGTCDGVIRDEAGRPSAVGTCDACGEAS